MDEKDRRAHSGRLRAALERYRGGRFETGDSGGAGGMMFFVDHKGKRWYIGGMSKEHAETVTAALNEVLALIHRT